jgi:hypothetical protein
MNDLAALADLAAKVPDERRRALEGQLPFASNPRFDAGLAAGLAHASQLVARQQGEEAARPLQEMAAVAAARALAEQRAYGPVRERMLSAAARAEVEAEIERVKSGQVELVPVEDTLRELDGQVPRPNDQDELPGRLQAR